MNFKSFWHFLVHEHVGYHRPSPVTPADHLIRVDFEARTAILAREIARLDAMRRAWSWSNQDQT